MNRRRFLGAVAAGSLALTWPRWRVLAEPTGPAPKRLIIVNGAFGWTRQTLRLPPPPGAEAADWTRDLEKLAKSEFSPVLRPLHRHRHRVVAIDGLSLVSAELDIPGYRHDKGRVHAWTGDDARLLGTEVSANAPTIDQVVAAHIGRPDRLPSIEISIDGAGHLSYAGRDLPLPASRTPEALWQRLFGPSAGGAGDAAGQERALAYATADNKALVTNLGAEQRQRLDVHLDLMSRLRKRLGSMANVTCQTPKQPHTANASYDARFDAFADLIGAAFACDLTRVASIDLGSMRPADFGWQHVTTHVHSGLAHHVFDNPTAHAAMTDYHAHHARQLARLADVLAGLKDVDGSTLLDNTLIVWGAETADGWHGYRGYCPVLIGGGWHFKTGRFVHLAEETPVSMIDATSKGGFSAACGRPHQPLLVSIAQAMGLPINHIGHRELRSKEGTRVGCAGPLGELT